MAQNKFENHIKKVLDERKIQPSKQAWDTLSKALATDETPQKKKYVWYAVAASIVGLLMLSMVYVVGGDYTETPESVVEVDNKTSEKNTPKEKVAIPKHEAFAYEEPDNTKEGTAKIEVRIKKAVKEEQTELVDTEEREAPELPITEQVDEAIIHSKLAEILAHVDSIENKQDALTEAEVDALLRKAQQDILHDKIVRENGRVNALALLNEVEEELDQSFREQIFKRLKSGFLKVRTAVADRNN